MAARARASSCLRRATRLASPLHAFGAFASVRLEKDVEIFPPVVVGDLLARLDLLPRAQDHRALDHVGFGVSDGTSDWHSGPCCGGSSQGNCRELQAGAANRIKAN